MRAAYIQNYGASEQLTVGERPEPFFGDNDVLVEIRAASVNPIDFKIRDGKLKFLRSYSFPLVLGHDFSGVVLQTGIGVTRFKPGDEVYGRPNNDRIGTFAERIAVNENELALKPRIASHSEAAGLPLVGLTSWQALVDVGHVQAGERVFIQAGAGGIGTFAIQLAKHLGAHVATTTSEKNTALVTRLGADEIIDYRKSRFETALPPQDFVFDTLGGEDLVKAFQVVKKGGTVVSISGVPDEKTAAAMGLGPFKSFILRLAGRKPNRLAARAGATYHFVFMKPNGNQLRQIAELVDAGKIKPVIDKEFPLDQAQAALDYSQSGRARGKVIITL